MPTSLDTHESGYTRVWILSRDVYAAGGVITKELRDSLKTVSTWRDTTQTYSQMTSMMIVSKVVVVTASVVKSHESPAWTHIHPSCKGVTLALM